MNFRTYRKNLQLCIITSGLGPTCHWLASHLQPHVNNNQAQGAAGGYRSVARVQEGASIGLASEQRERLGVLGRS
jgi:hypothetical protein